MWYQMLSHIIILFSWMLHQANGVLAQSNTPGIVWTVGWSHDDQYIAVGNEKGVLSIYATKDWKKIHTWQATGSTITRIEWNPRSLVLAVAAVNHGTDSVIQLFDIGKNKVIRRMPLAEQGRAISWSPDGERVAVVGNAGSIRIYRKNGTHLKTLSFRNQSSLFDIDWHPLKNVLLAVEENIFFIDIDRDSLLAKFDDGTTNKGILCCQWHPTGKFFVTGDYGHENEGGDPSYIKYWKPDGTLIKTIKESKSELRNLRWSRDGKTLAAAGDGLLLFNDSGHLTAKRKLSKDNVWGIAWNKNGTKMLCSDQAGRVFITDSKGNLIRSVAP